MAKFTLKVKEGRNVEETSFEGSKIVIGSNTSNFVALNEDPLIKPAHASIAAVQIGDQVEFRIEDMQTSSGTYVNGRAIKGLFKLPAEFSLVVGATKLECKINEATQTVEILRDVKNAPFYFDPAVDYMKWSEREVGFGKFAPVRVGNWWAVLLSLALVPLFVLPFTSDPLLDPGPIAGAPAVKRPGITGGVSKHGWSSRTFHVAALGSAYEKDLQKLPESDRDCSACHDAFGSTPDTKCLKCHEEVSGGERIEGSHPFGDAHARWRGESCRTCHVEHRDASKELSLIAIEAKASCAKCHPDGMPKMNAQLAAAPAKVPEATEKLAWAAFSHKDHKDKKVDCKDCHKIDPNAPMKSAESRREFKALAYETCMDCHGEKASHAKKVTDPKKIFAAKWHGAEETKGKECLACHNEVYQKALKTSDYERVDRTFSYTTKAHQELTAAFESQPEKDRCSTCHPNQAKLAEVETLPAKPFTHFSHAVNLLPKGTDAAAVIGKLGQKGTCKACHADIAGAEALPGPAHPEIKNADLETCQTCHTSKRPEPKETRQPVAKRVEFPHKLHDVAGVSCFECHEFKDEPGFALPVTPAKVKDCTQCHKNHEKMAGNACARCHKPGDKVYWNDDKQEADGTPHRVTWTHAADLSFSHMSRGHKDLTEKSDCAACHDAERTWAAESIAQTPVPRDGEPLCRKCHVEEMARFHWR